MAKRGFCFYWGFVTRHWLGDLPGILLGLPAQRMTPAEIRHGIHVIDPTPQTKAQFSSFVEQALSLIAASAPARFARVRTQIRTIINTAGLIGSVYEPAFRVCAVNFRCFGCLRDAPDSVAFLASTFVRDAMVGYLVNQGAFRTRRNYDRFDRLCCTEARRFMQHLGMTTTPWDAENLSRIRLEEALKEGLADIVASERESARSEPK